MPSALTSSIALTKTSFLAMEPSLRHGVVDARKLLEHDAAGTDVEVTHLGVAHLAVGKTHVLARKRRAWCGVLSYRLSRKGVLAAATAFSPSAGARPQPSMITIRECRKMTLCHMSLLACLDDHRGEVGSLERSAAHEGAVNVGLGNELGDVAGLQSHHRERGCR